MQTLTTTAIWVLGFVKEGGIWYADIPKFLEWWMRKTNEAPYFKKICQYD